jgi:hypothetical protein
MVLFSEFALFVFDDGRHVPPCLSNFISPSFLPLKGCRLMYTKLVEPLKYPIVLGTAEAG